MVQRQGGGTKCGCFSVCTGEIDVARLWRREGLRAAVFFLLRHVLDHALPLRLKCKRSCAVGAANQGAADKRAASERFKARTREKAFRSPGQASRCVFSCGAATQASRTRTTSAPYGHGL